MIKSLEKALSTCALIDCPASSHSNKWFKQEGNLKQGAKLVILLMITFTFNKCLSGMLFIGIDHANMMEYCIPMSDTPTLQNY